MQTLGASSSKVQFEGHADKEKNGKSKKWLQFGCRHQYFHQSKPESSGFDEQSRFVESLHVRSSDTKQSSKQSQYTHRITDNGKPRIRLVNFDIFMYLKKCLVFLTRIRRFSRVPGVQRWLL